ncbi:MAG: hypothetical protein D0433_01290 [Candidatus Thermochlorobacter aerophilum]|uniref:Uncharacterized protein n=1 Tax=Candidatus Thermochlorobacter aerophilus TaxID=1868324 RepID=A0A395M3A6_9BACT|nr:MAG: hypothetical protein D0433_01290 [Candidatus Thermochlorobacter aerophilum]
MMLLQNALGMSAMRVSQYRLAGLYPALRSDGALDALNTAKYPCQNLSVLFIQADITAGVNT